MKTASHPQGTIDQRSTIEMNINNVLKISLNTLKKPCAKVLLKSQFQTTSTKGTKSNQSRWRTLRLSYLRRRIVQFNRDSAPSYTIDTENIQMLRKLLWCFLPTQLRSRKVEINNSLRRTNNNKTSNSKILPHPTKCSKGGRRNHIL